MSFDFATAMLALEEPQSAPTGADGGDAADAPRAPHVPVMLEEVRRHLMLQPRDVVVDATVGAAGHAADLLAALGPQGRLLGFDRDPRALALAQVRLGGDARVELRRARFSELASELDALGVERADAWLFDLGVSSMQLDEPERGFSFQKDGPLDLRMAPEEGGLSAADVVNRFAEKDLADLLYQWGEERASRRIARALVEARRRQKFTRTAQLAQLVRSVIPFSRADAGRIHPATRTFQALRLYVNDELGELSKGLDTAIARLAPGGRIAVLAYHSLEDRIVKERFRRAAADGFEIVTKRPLQADETQTQLNPRARSAKLRVLRNPESRVPAARGEQDR